MFAMELYKIVCDQAVTALQIKNIFSWKVAHFSKF